MRTQNNINLSLLNYRITLPEKLIWEELIKNASKFVDIIEILSQWVNAKKHFEIYNRSLPKPVWDQRSFEHNGKQAWYQLSYKVPIKKNNDSISIYIHIPFCDKRCKFCDCYSIPIRKSNKKIEYTYTEVLLHEMEAWKNILNIDKRPVSTIHFGGGTPNCIDRSLFDKIIKQCHNCFNITDQTEFAIESISSLLTDEHLNELRQWGFSRLHVGVQTLDDRIRCLIGRRENSKLVIDKLKQALKFGFVVSVDIILGLPKQTISGFINTIQKLIDIGIHGFSLYQLQISKFNKRFIEKEKDMDRVPLFEYLLFQIAEQYLILRNYQKNHFDHFSQPGDHSLYSTHMSREEDLLAIGANADGLFDFYHYRHPKIKDYTSNTNLDIPALEGGLWESSLERRIRPAITCLMIGCVNKSILKDLNAETLLEFWLECSLIKEELNQRKFILTANGSWFINDMINQVTKVVAS